jgi:drug/metabolite transporter (DMT)-like permease
MKKEYLMITIAAILWGLIVFGGQVFVNLGYSVYEISVYSLGFIALTLLIVILIKRELLIKREMLGFFVIYGVIGALVNVTQYMGLVFGVPVAIVALLLYTQPVWTIVFGKAMLKEKVTKKKILAVMVAMTGIIVLMSPWQIESMPNLKGLLSAILAGIFLSLWMIWGRKSGINKQHCITTTFGYAFFSFLWLLIAYPFINRFFHNPMFRLSFELSPQMLFWFFIFAFITQVVSIPLFYKGLEKVEASKAGVIASLEPVSATVLAAIFFAQPITIPIIIGGALILFSNYIVET